MGGGKWPLAGRGPTHELGVGEGRRRKAASNFQSSSTMLADVAKLIIHPFQTIQLLLELCPVLRLGGHAAEYPELRCGQNGPLCKPGKPVGGAKKEGSMSAQIFTPGA